jgi:hypothetical protein
VLLLPVRSKTELGNQPQEAQEPHSGLDVLLHGFLCLSIFTLISRDWVKILYGLTKTVSGSPLLFSMVSMQAGSQFLRIQPQSLPSGTPPSMLFVQRSAEKSVPLIESLDGIPHGSLDASPRRQERSGWITCNKNSRLHYTGGKS